ncbi:MAG: fructosamine kinase family protein [Planctomycetota bacterium]|nr:fructosamine kinase family protein [Planctomycetota bacterium]
MSQELDISWQVLRRITRDWNGEAAEPVEVTPLDGGCISTTVAIQFADHSKAVCKISAHRVDRSYVNEAHQLRLLAGLGLPVPAVYAAEVGTLDDPHSYILMEFVEGVNLGQAKKTCTPEEFDGLQTHLAELLLLLHQNTAPSFTRVEIEPQPNPFSAWPAFFRHIFDNIADETFQSKLLAIKCRKQIAKLHERLDQLLMHDDVPRLVHWDLWASNILARRDETGTWRITALLDPNCKYAHAEAEMAYLALFRTSTPAFMKAYQREKRLTDDYHRVRKPIYQLYFLLNHMHLFGQEYAPQVTAAVERIGCLV